MTTFICDDPEVESLLQTMRQQVVDNGGFIHDDLVFECQNGDLKVRVPDSVPGGERIMMLPKICLLPHGKFKLGLKDDAIVIESHDADISDLQVSLMNTMIAVYNRTGKVAASRNGSTMALYYNEPDLFERLADGRNKSEMAFIQNLPETETDDFALNVFIKTRVLGYKEVLDDGRTGDEGGEDDDRAQAVKEPPFARTQVLMPMIDFLNHHPAAGGFLVRSDYDDIAEPEAPRHPALPDEDGIAVVNSCPVDGSDECFVCYGTYDALDTLLHYNYVEQYAGYMRSVPLTVSLPGYCKIVIRAAAARPRFTKLPDQLRDLVFFLPAMTPDAGKKTITLSHLLIPQARAPRALRRVLGAAMSRLGLSIPNDEMLAQVKIAEAKIVEANLRFYEELGGYLDQHPLSPDYELIAENIRLVIETQLRNLRAYPFYEEARRHAGSDGSAGGGQKKQARAL